MRLTRILARPALLGSVLGALAAGPAAAEIGQWVEAPNVRVRLVGTALPDGAIAAAVEVVLNAGWKTYWRLPGEGGLAPVFDFSRSWNLTAAEVGYAPPHRYNDGFAVTNIYEGRVLFPVELTPGVAGAPTMLQLTLDLGVCEVICIPVQLEAMLAISPGQVDLEAQQLIEEARALLPGAPREGAFVVTAVEPTAVGDRTVDYRVTALVPQALGAELFVEAPKDWWVTAAQQVAQDGNRVTYAFSLDRPTTTTPLTGTPLRLTLVSGPGAIEQWVTLP